MGTCPVSQLLLFFPGEMPGMPRPPLAASHRRIAALSAAGMGTALSERRSSATSTVSSAYTVSRRSSLVSPYLAGPYPAGEAGAVPGATASADGYDPISPDGSRRSSDASHCGGLPGVGSLTPAQRYRLKAKYAAATGGPPPTPLPGVERVGTGAHNSFGGDCAGPAEPASSPMGCCGGTAPTPPLATQAVLPIPWCLGAVCAGPATLRGAWPRLTLCPGCIALRAWVTSMCRERAEPLCSPWGAPMPTCSAQASPRARPASVRASSWRA